MVKRDDCSKNKENECDKTLERLEKYLLTENRERPSQEFKEIMKSVLKSCSYTPPKYFTMDDIDSPIHVKSWDMIIKHAKVCLRKGILPNGHRGDYIKVKNGHGTYIPFNRKAH